MAYIGPLPAETFTSFATQEFSTSATTSYTLNHPVTNENEIALFINNVRQQPGSGKAYTATGTALTLSAATASTDTMYAVFLGRALQTVNPAGGSVGSSQITAEMITGQTALAATPADTDELLISDAGVLKRIDYSYIKSNPTHVLLSTATVSSGVSEVDITSNIDSTYKVYMIELINVHQATNDTIFRMRFFQGGAVDTGSAYDWVYQRYQANSVNTAEYGLNADHIKLSYASHNVNEASLSGRFLLYNPSDTTFNTHVNYNLTYQVDGDQHARIDGTARLEETAAVDGVRFYFSSGNIDSGLFKLYGVN
jgi:hypothetical protein